MISTHTIEQDGEPSSNSYCVYEFYPAVSDVAIFTNGSNLQVDTTGQITGYLEPGLDLTVVRTQALSVLGRVNDYRQPADTVFT